MIYMNGCGYGRDLPGIKEEAPNMRLSLLAFRLIEMYSIRWPR